LSTDIEGIGMTSQRTRERLINRLCEQGIVNINVLEVMRTMPRHIFLDEALSHRAYEDTSLPIGYKQTLSQPYIVAKMTELILSGNKINKVLEIGTGSGYQCAVLSQLVKKVYSVERIARFQDLGIKNIETKFSDGKLGWEEKAPFDAIIATAASDELPQQLLNQLSPNGIIVLPLKTQSGQELRVFSRVKNTNETEERFIEPVRFVPMLSGVTK
jgi:protein-L-isoaspartate(D-aspartate) O-methyltransferase